MKSRIINLKTVLKSGEYFPKAQILKRPIFTGIFFSVATLPQGSNTKNFDKEIPQYWYNAKNFTI